MKERTHEDEAKEANAPAPLDDSDLMIVAGGAAGALARAAGRAVARATGAAETALAPARRLEQSQRSSSPRFRR